jgi:hypothetical protein
MERILSQIMNPLNLTVHSANHFLPRFRRFSDKYRGKFDDRLSTALENLETISDTLEQINMYYKDKHESLGCTRSRVFTSRTRLSYACMQVD